ncbi:COG4315 family predicted lipoprotein [Halorarius litoreus]|uniref:COG4315 family predicted lipoprotein n=1 Tax=Halorarius litoreus TaxID=2962676 RepID=UPI0020CD3E61|nr:twin-arginine translocation signal domain-containing protein [Halorarius litoreus]
MDPSRRTFLGAVAVSVGLAGCTGGPGVQPTDSPTAEPTPEPTATPEPTPESTETPTPMAAATVQVATHPEYGDILVDDAGLSLYLFTRDTQGEGSSVCSGECADAWPPLTVTESPTAGDGVTAELSTFERDSGELQVAAAGWPLYYFASDEEPGDTNGQGVGDVWWLVTPDGTAIEPSGTSTPTPTASYY